MITAAGSLLVVASLLLLPQHAHGKKSKRSTGAHGSVILDGVSVRVWWNDGDSFTPRRGTREKPVRVVGYNTLETHGAVHQWGSWTAGELLAVTVRATQVAASKVRQCTSEGRPDAYGRPLVRCPDVARELVSDGLAMAFAVKEGPDQELVSLQSAAQASGKGMWAKGVPETVLTSVHSLGEKSATNGGGRKNGQATAYNRVAHTGTGTTSQLRHTETFQICQLVCAGSGKDRSCMTYVPFGRQRRHQPDCLR